MDFVVEAFIHYLTDEFLCLGGKSPMLADLEGKSFRVDELDPLAIKRVSAFSGIEFVVTLGQQFRTRNHLDYGFIKIFVDTLSCEKIG